MKRVRFVPILDRLGVALEPLLQNLRDDERIFSFNRMRRSFATACRLAGVKGVRWQDLRHTGIMRMLDATKDPAKVMKVTGHQNWKTFLKYVNLNPEIAREMAHAMNTDRAERSILTTFGIIAEPEPIEIDSIN